MKNWDRVACWQRRLRLWRDVLARVEQLIGEDRQAGKVDPDLVYGRRLIMRRITRLKRLLKKRSAGLKKNSLHPLQNAADNASLSGVSNG